MKAKAPYNFAPLNNSVIKAPELPVFGKYELNRFSGFIELYIETKTPFYIDDGEESFFQVNGRPIIPGSSLRGMVRVFIEIASYGKFTFFGDKRLYYRAVGDLSALGEKYRGLLVDAGKNYQYKFKAGFLVKERNIYKIYPSKAIDGTQIYRINFSDVPSDLNIQENYGFKEIYFKNVREDNHKHIRIRGNREETYFLRYALVKEIYKQQQIGTVRGYLIKTGNFPRKHMHWIINEKDSTQPIIVPRRVVEDYLNDVARSKKYNLLNFLDFAGLKEVPCFYLLDQRNNVVAFGHTGFFRVPYSYTIGEHIPEELRNADFIDFAEAIFGKEGKWVSRVYFEDGKLLNENEDIFMPRTSPKILASPKPTTFQHYLEQPEELLNNHDPGRLKNWNDRGAKIRGHKLYWHRNTSSDSRNQYSWNEGRICEDTQHKKIQPIKEGVKFKAKIRFENLTSEELGAILFVLDLPENHYHKLGMGKPPDFVS